MSFGLIKEIETVAVTKYVIIGACFTDIPKHKSKQVIKCFIA